MAHSGSCGVQIAKARNGPQKTSEQNQNSRHSERTIFGNFTAIIRNKLSQPPTVRRSSPR